MALHDWIKEEWDGEEKGEGWKTDFGELDSYELAKGLVNKPGDPDKPKPNMEKIEAASVEAMSRQVNDPYWSQPDHASEVSEPPSDTEIFVKAAELATPKDVRDWRQRIFDEEQIRAEARAEVNPMPTYDPTPVSEEAMQEYEALADSDSDSGWDFSEDPYQDVNAESEDAE